MARLLPSNVLPTLPWQAADAAYGVSDEPDWRGIDWRAHQHDAVVRGRRLHYVDYGAGDEEPVLFVHGLGGCWQNWLENIPRFGASRRVIAVDLPGFGDSEMPRGYITITGFAGVVEDLCERLGLGRIDVVGNSMGGFVGAEMALRYPARVDRLVLVAAAGITSANVYRRPTVVAGRIVAAIVTNTAARHRWIARRPTARHIALALVARHPALLKPDAVFEGLMRGTGREGFNDALVGLLEYDFRDRLEGVRAPTLVIWGEQDTLLPAEDAREFERRMPNTSVLMMRDTGHVPMFERPRAFNDAVIEFIEGGPVGAYGEPVPDARAAV
jgi:pimeloyl-ACP methyl ester carboxylesterase